MSTPGASLLRRPAFALAVVVVVVEVVVIEVVVLVVAPADVNQQDLTREIE